MMFKTLMAALVGAFLVSAPVYAEPSLGSGTTSTIVETKKKVDAPVFETIPGINPAKISGLTVDPGGSVIERMRTVELLREAQAPVKIDGLCISACTMLLSLPKACVQPWTVFGFHAASQGFGTISEFGNKIVSKYYPPKIKQWVEDTGALTRLELTYMDAERAWELGVPRCD